MRRPTNKGSGVGGGPSGREKLAEEGQDGYEFYLKVIHIIQAAGFRLFDRDDDAKVDFSFIVDRGRSVGVICKNAIVRASRMLPKLSHDAQTTRYNELLVVAHGFSRHIRERYEVARNFWLVDMADLQGFLTRYEPTERRQVRSRPVGHRIKASRNEILTACAGLAALIDEKLTTLKSRRPNSPDAIAERDASIADYEALKAKVAELQRAVLKFTSGKIQQKAIETKATSYGKTVERWWAKQGGTVLTTSSGVALFSLSVLVGCMLGVNPNLAAVLSGGLVGGKELLTGAAKIIKKQ